MPGECAKSLTSTTDTAFLETLREWLRSQSEIMVLIQYSRAAGDKSFELFTSFDTLSERLHQLTAATRVTAFRQQQLPLRGLVDEKFVHLCLSSIPDGAEFVVAETIPRTAGQTSWFHHEAGDSHVALREALERSRGNPAAVGKYPPWLQESPEVISGYVPDENGIVRRGVY
jgi:hypothetical protein